MAQSKASRLFDRIDQWEFQLCRNSNQALRYPFVRGYLRTVSRLGDGWLWYGVIALIALHGEPDSQALAMTLTATGLTCTLLYKTLKHRLVRERPFISFPGIQCAIAPLDRYSFPSGHTLHAVGFNSLLLLALPIVGLILLPFTFSVMASRVVLGLHYPSDVVAGAVIGLIIGVIAWLTLPQMVQWLLLIVEQG
ncbi:MAG: phosphatase PAP2 family protein [Halomonadaceae bacterium]|nr:MAG: phosphatase PAP2 family protein [Halomonadaceae bacterium]